MAPANIFLALLDSASIAHDVAKLEALKANAKTEDARAPSAGEEWRHPIPYGAQTAPETEASVPEASAPPPPTETASAPPPPPDAVGAGWLLERCRALDSAVGASELACGCVDAAKRDDASMQQALMELLGFGDKALELMGELCEKKAAVAAVDVRDIRAIATASGVAACAEINQ